ncbi:succinate dehydrogenase, cytochrome b556 subunit [Hyphomonas sp.]|uniref:succinate dehydrogenase, cytochrome b556 subunit n=1 Tax=Hyphomonas sp. TaxID=87 RepID=UPI0025C4DE60|nr:succinate dehydrogenase, cytochrome b556 subunit [Hyphomonas sp.]MBI1401404.1 succinate dehydrogenase, cytochrome b556 subunit [Hyphomonas sp.]
MSGTQKADSRPVSPHLQIWRFHATMAASITHRFTGMALYGGTLLIAAWLFALASGPDAYAMVEAAAFSIPGQILLFLWAVAILYHFANGIRHLVWDGPGAGFDPKVASQISIFNYVFAIVGASALMFAAMNS